MHAGTALYNLKSKSVYFAILLVHILCFLESPKERNTLQYNANKFTLPFKFSMRNTNGPTGLKFSYYYYYT